ncbi:tripartite tricarboxylate transporter substrate-binding protein [Comamonas faecalis]|uniref:Tripartite tricarboxylate transporter substrate-binding protein n=1 Tax=Comamonas faecalis TaxID=1387849 RepID=A0ABP7QXQ5_9BURK
MLQSSIVKIAALACAAALACTTASAQAPSNAPVKIIIGFSAGGALDSMARAMSEKLRTDLGRTVIVDNKPGASTQIALGAVKRAPADGNTILISPASPFVLQPLTYDKLPFDPDKDFIPVAHLADTPLVATTATGSPFSSMREYVDWVKKNPNDTGVGMVTLGGVLHFGLLQLNQEMGLDLTPIAYKGAPPMLTDEIGGALPVGMDIVASASELVKAGKIKYLGVPGMERTQLAPEVPTFIEQGVKGFEIAPAWFAAFVPAGTPANVVSALAKAMTAIVQDPEFSAKMAQLGMVTTGRPGSDVTELIATQREALRPIVEKSGFRATQ